MNTKIKFLILIISFITTMNFAQIKTELKEKALLYYTILDNGDASAMKKLLASNLIDHDSHGGNAVEGIVGLTLGLKAGFKNQKHTIELLEFIGEDKVFIRWRMTGKHVGEFFGMPASNKEVNFVGHDVLRIKNGKISEVWHVENLLGMMEQITIK